MLKREGIFMHKWKLSMGDGVSEQTIEAHRCCLNSGFVIFYRLDELIANELVVAAFPQWQIREVKLVE
jgi:hypothetical protein